MVEILTKIWENGNTLSMAKIFESYMKSIGAKKYDDRRKNNQHTYLIDGRSSNWNRVECYYYKDSTKYSEENLTLVLRKKSGDYFLVKKEGLRAFEVDYSGLKHHDKDLLQEIIEEHKFLFDTLCKTI